MKKALAAIVLILQGVFAFAQQTFTVGDVLYRVTSDRGDTCMVQSCNTAAKGELEIPRSIKHNNTIYQVEGIDEGAFSGCKSLTKISFYRSPKDKEITKEFLGCTHLNSFRLKDGKATFYLSDETVIEIFDSITATNGESVVIGSASIDTSNTTSDPNDLGVRYFEGNGVEKDYGKAAELFRKAAEQGNIKAQYNLGVCYREGKGVEQNHSIAVIWFRKAAERGHADAQNILGVCYTNEQGVTQDFSEAIKWYDKAAVQGNAAALRNLGYMHEKGFGVVKDIDIAKIYYTKAAEKGYQDAKERLEAIMSDAGSQESTRPATEQ